MSKFLFLLSILFYYSPVKTQNTTPLLLTKGAELEYQTFSSRPKGFGKLELYEVTRITLTVTDVKDSNGIKYAYINKTGKAIERSEQNRYEKKYIVVQENNKLRIPKDLFSIDTVYLSDRYPELKKGKGFHAVMQMKDQSYIVSDLNAQEKGIFNYSSGSDEILVKSREFIVEGPQYRRQAGDEIYYGGILRTNDYTLQISSIEVKSEGNTTFKVRAGSFKCHKLTVSSKIKVKGAGLIASLMKGETATTVYYSPEIGILKTEDISGKNQTGYIELIRIKR